MSTPAIVTFVFITALPPLPKIPDLFADTFVMYICMSIYFFGFAYAGQTCADTAGHFLLHGDPALDIVFSSIIFQRAKHRSRTTCIDNFCIQMHFHGWHPARFLLSQHYRLLWQCKLRLCFLNSSRRNMSQLRYPRTICFSQFNCFASSNIGGIPIPPPIRNAFFPFNRKTISQAVPLLKDDLRSVFRKIPAVPFPAIRYTRCSAESSLSISQILIGRGSNLASVITVNGNKLSWPWHTARFYLSLATGCRSPVSHLLPD